MRKVTRRIFGTLCGSAVLCCGASVYPQDQAAKPFPWRTQEINGRPSVPAADVARYLGQEPAVREQDTLLFKGPALTMRWNPGSTRVEIGDDLFQLAFPVVENGHEHWVTVLDWEKTLEPLLAVPVKTIGLKFDTVVIDVGHGGVDVGAVSPKRDVSEKTVALATALKLRDLLAKDGYQVVMTRTKDVFLSRAERNRIASEAGDAIVVSVHFNSGSPVEKGVETYALTAPGRIGNAANLRLAAAVQSKSLAALQSFGAIDRGVRRARFDVLTGLKKPGILVEGGYLTNATEASQIATEAYQQALAGAIAEGVREFQKAVQP